MTSTLLDWKRKHAITDEALTDLVTKGGEHHCANWFIQTQIDNQKQGEKVLDTQKMTHEEQEKYIKNNMPPMLDSEYAVLAISLLLKFETVYEATYRG